MKPLPHDPGLAYAHGPSPMTCAGAGERATFVAASLALSGTEGP